MSPVRSPIPERLRGSGTILPMLMGNLFGRSLRLRKSPSSQRVLMTVISVPTPISKRIVLIIPAGAAGIVADGVTRTMDLRV